MNKEKETNVYVPNDTDELVEYTYADTVITCKACGKDTAINHPAFKNVQTGIQLPFLKTDNKHFMGLSCAHCKAALTLRFVEATAPPAHDFSHKGFDLESVIDLNWKSGSNVKEFKVFLAKLPETQPEGYEPEYKLISEDSTETKYTLHLEDSVEYNLRVDSVYDIDGEEVITPSEVIFLTSKPYSKGEIDEVPQADIKEK